MGFIEAIKSGYNRAFDFQGRSSRSEYWFWTLYQFLVTGALVAFTITSIFYMGSENLEKVKNDLDHKQVNHQQELMFKVNDSDDFTELVGENGNVDQEKLKDKVDKVMNGDAADEENIELTHQEVFDLMVAFIQVYFWAVAPIIIWWLVHIIPNLSLSIRRLHDINCSGFLYLLNFIGLNIVIFVMSLLAGTPGDNKYGPDPWASGRKKK